MKNSDEIQHEKKMTWPSLPKDQNIGLNNLYLIYVLFSGIMLPKLVDGLRLSWSSPLFRSASISFFYEYNFFSSVYVLGESFTNVKKD